MDNQHLPFSDMAIAGNFLYQVGRLRKALVGRMNASVREAGIDLKPEQIPVVMVISKYPGISQQEIADLIMRDKSSVLRSINTLLQRSLLTVSPDDHDKRKNRIALNDAGLQLAAKIKALTLAAEEEALSVFSLEERKEIEANLKSYADRITRN